MRTNKVSNVLKTETANVYNNYAPDEIQSEIVAQRSNTGSRLIHYD